MNRTTSLAVGTYTGGLAGVPGRGSGVSIVEFDRTTATFVDRGLLADVENASWLLPHPSLDVIYTALEGTTSSGGRGEIAVLRRGVDRPIAAMATTGTGPCHLSIDPTGRHLWATTYTGGTIEEFVLDDDGSLAARGAVVQRFGSGPRSTRQDSSHPHATVWLHDLLVACDLGTDELAVHDSTGKPLHTIATEPGAGPRQAAPIGDAGHLIVVNELSRSASLVSIDRDGTGEVLHTISVAPDSVDGHLGAAVAVDAEEAFAFVSTRGHDSIAVLSLRDTDAGRLHLESVHHLSGCGPRHIAWVDGTLFVSLQGSDRIVALELDRATARLREIAQLDGIGTPVHLVGVRDDVTPG